MNSGRGSCSVNDTEEEKVAAAALESRLEKLVLSNEKFD
jgi:hypothetical protein